MVIIGLPCVLWFVVSEPAVQTFITRKAGEVLSRKLNTKVSVESVDFKLFNRFVLHGIYVEDQKQDTLLSIHKVDVGLNYFSLGKNTFHFGKIELDRLTFKLKQDTAGHLNLDFIIAALKTSADSSPARPLVLSARELVIKNLSYVMHLGKRYHYRPHGMNYHDLEVRRMHIHAHRIKLEKDLLTADIEKIALHEKCGFNIKKLAGKLHLSAKEIRMDQLYLEDDYSKIKAKYYSMQHASFRSYREYVREVTMLAEFQDAEVDFKTIGFFAPKIKDWPLHFTKLNGVYRGPVADMHGKQLSMTYKGNTHLKLDFSIVGLSETDSTRFTVQLHDLQGKRAEMEELATRFHIPIASVSPYLAAVDSFQLSGRFDGFYYRFNADLNLNSPAVGKLAIQAFYDLRDHKTLVAQVKSPGIEAGKILHQHWLSQIAFEVNTRGQFDSQAGGVELETDVKIDSVRAFGTVLKHLSLQSSLHQKQLKFESACKDARFRLQASGQVDWQDSIPKGALDIQQLHCNLSSLGWRKSRDSSIIRSQASLSLRGSHLDNLFGLLRLNHFAWTEGNKSINTQQAQIRVDNSEENRFLRLTSSLATAEILSHKPLSQLWPGLRSLLNQFLPNLGISVPTNALHWGWGAAQATNRKMPLNKLQRIENPDYTISLYGLSLKDLGGFVAEGLILADSTGGRLSWNQKQGWATLRLLSPSIELGTLHIEQSSLIFSAVQDSALCQSITNRISMGGLMFKEVHLNHLLTRNRIQSLLTYQNDQQLSNSGHFSFDTHLLPKLAEGIQMRVGIRPSYLVVNNDVWSIPQSSVHLHGKAVSIQQLTVKHSEEHIDLNGTYSGSSMDTLKLQVGDFNMNNFNSLTSNMKFQGRINGYAHVLRSGDVPIFVTRMLGENIKMGDTEVGNVQLLSLWNTQMNRLDVRIDSRNQEKNEFTFYGHYTPDKHGQIYGKGELNKTRLALIKPLVKSIFSDVKGHANGQFALGGSLHKPTLNGLIALDTAKLTLDFTRTTYTFSDTVRIMDNEMVLRDVRLSDGQGGKAHLNAVASKIGSPDFSYHVSIDPQNLACLNVKENEQRPIYGTAYASGQVVISGNTKKNLLKIVASTNENTNISIPLQKGGSVNENAFVQFKKKEKVEPKASNRIYDPIRKQEQKMAQSGADFGIEMQIAATPDAEVRLVIDPQTGDAIEAMGRGNIKLELYPSRDIFRLFGSYVIERGEYTFSIQNLINKRFKIEPNSRINFNGSINDATLNIQTTYKLRASLGALLGDTTERYSKKVPVDCIVSMSGKLTSPTLKFAIDAPTSDLETRGRMRSALNTEEKTVQQFIYLLVMNQFMNDQQALGVINNGNAVATAGVTIGEMISGALSSFVANTFKNVDLNIGVNYRVNSANQTDWEVNFSTNITDRVSLTGNVDMPGGAQNRYGAANNGEVTGDIDLEVRLDRSGNVKFKAFSHSRDQFTDDLGTARHGLGIFYQKDFNAFKDLFRRKKKPEQQQNQIKNP